LGLLLLDYYFIIGIKVEISKKVPLGKKVYCFHVERKKRQNVEKGKKRTREQGIEGRKSLKLQNLPD
jgi:hypothetical protein